MGWATVLAYGATAVLCFIASTRDVKQGVGTFWIILAAVLTFLMINKQLDLQSALTAIGRCVSQMQGWYDKRQSVQILFIVSILVASVILGIALFWTMRRHVGSVWLAMTGFVCLLSFVAVRAIGFHHFDAFIGFRILNVRMNWVLELGGIALIAVNATGTILFRGQEDPFARNHERLRK